MPVNVMDSVQLATDSCDINDNDGFAACQDSVFDDIVGDYVCPDTIEFQDQLELACSVFPVCREFVDEWIFNIADFVTVMFGVDNDGSYLVKLRFYPLPLN